MLGLDGISVGDLREAIDRGLVPNVAAIARRGSLMPVRSSLPAVSAVAWSSFMTACNPGRHGIFGFTDVQPDDYRLHFPSSADLRAPTLWERAAADGLRSVVVNLPGTYPARPMKGSLVAGFVAPDIERACHPPGLAARLVADGYTVDVDVTRAHHGEAAFAGHLLDVLDHRIAAMERLLAEGRWSLAILTFTEADRLQHVAYRRAHRPEGPLRDALDAWFVRIDALLGRIMAQHPDASIVGLSDHGFGPLDRYMNIDAWLGEHGYLGRGAAAAPDSRAFSLDPGRIYVNSSDDFPGGPVDPGEARDLAAEISGGLREVVDPQTQRTAIVGAVLRRDAYKGARRRLAPSLVCLPERGYELKSSRRLPLFSDVTDFEGTHTYDDALFLCDVPATAIEGSIEDVGATVLDRLSLHHEDVDGRSLVA